jgi:riboflavin biosynthesis pyrimidine reductase
LVEGGAKTAAGLIAAGLVNEVVLFFAPESATQGGAQVRGWAGWDWRRVSATSAGRDLCLRGILKGAN